MLAQKGGVLGYTAIRRNNEFGERITATILELDRIAEGIVFVRHPAKKTDSSGDETCFHIIKEVVEMSESKRRFNADIQVRAV